VSNVTLPFGHKAPPPTPVPVAGRPSPGKPRWPVPLAICAGSIVAQWFPPTGVVLMLLLAPAWSLVLLNATLVLMIMDVRRGAAPRWLIAVPIAAYLINFIAFGISGWQALSLKSEIEARNASQHLAFDPAHDAILADRSTSASLVALYHLPVAYAPKAATDPGLGHYYDLRPVLKPTANQPCSLSDGRGAQLLPPATINGVVVTNLCVASRPVDTTAPMITVTTRHTTLDRGLTQASLTEMTLHAPDGRTATYAYGWTSVLSPIPLPFIGCALNDAANSWQCGAQLIRLPITVGPEKMGLVGGGEVEAGAMGAMLGLTPRTVTVTKPARPLELPMGEADTFGVAPLDEVAQPAPHRPAPGAPSGRSR
jgi:hypothetical protein